MGRVDGPAGVVGVEGGDDGGDVGPLPVDHGEVAGAGIVRGDQVEGHDDRGGVVDGQGLLVISRAGRSPHHMHAAGGQVAVGGAVAGLLQVLVEDHPHPDPAGGVPGQVRFRPAVPELVHGEVDGAMRPGDEPADRPDSGPGLGQHPEPRGPVRGMVPVVRGGAAWPMPGRRPRRAGPPAAHCAALARGRRRRARRPAPRRRARSGCCGAFQCAPGDFAGIFRPFAIHPPGSDLTACRAQRARSAPCAWLVSCRSRPGADRCPPPALPG